MINMNYNCKKITCRVLNKTYNHVSKKFPVAILVVVLATFTAFITISADHAHSFSAKSHESLPDQTMDQENGILSGHGVNVYGASIHRNTLNLKNAGELEMMLISDMQDTTSNVIDTANSDLPSNQVNTIYVDSKNVKWIGTSKGLARYTDSTWTVYAKNDTLADGDVVMLNSNIKDIDYELTMYGDELWMATDSGLTVASYDTIDGITGATTYHRGNSILLRDTILDVALDVSHNRWIVTDTAITIFRGPYNGDTLYTLQDLEPPKSYAIRDYKITDIQSYAPDSQVFISTAGKGIARSSYDQVDGFSGASAFMEPWSKLISNNVQAIAVKGEIQWYGTDAGAALNMTNEAKGGWTQYRLEEGIVDTNVISVHIDDKDNIWFGTKQGLSVMAGNDMYKYTEDLGLISNTINHITSDMKGNIWIATPAGIEWFGGIPGIISLKSPVLISPGDNTVGIPVTIALTWQSVSGATGYKLQVDTVYTLENPWITVENLSSANYSLSGLKDNHQYFWRIAATRTGETGPWSEIWNFTTQTFSNVNPYVSEGMLNLTIYPNPVHDYLYLQGQCTRAQNIRVRIYTVNGQLTGSPVDIYANKNTFNLMINISDNNKYNPGVYILQVTGETFEQKIKILIQ